MRGREKSAEVNVCATRRSCDERTQLTAARHVHSISDMVNPSPGLDGERLSKFGDLVRKWFRQAQRLFHMAVALVFLVLTLAGAAVSFSLWADYQKAPSQGPWGFGMVAVFTVLLFIFCLYSFAKARSVGSSRESREEILAEPTPPETVTRRDVPQ